MNTGEIKRQIRDLMIDYATQCETEWIEIAKDMYKQAETDEVFWDTFHRALITRMRGPVGKWSGGISARNFVEVTDRDVVIAIFTGTQNDHEKSSFIKRRLT